MKTVDPDEGVNTLPEVESTRPVPREEDQTKTAGTYAIGLLLGKGGQGEVWLAHDKRIGRDVALKRLKHATPSEDDTSRFLREARVQARLDHPAIVPVYDLGRDELGRPFFTMKRLAGHALDKMLSTTPHARQKLLRAFVDVCRAVDFAHSRGVVHRDLKPANIILGEFGEVYVIDWGVARVIGDVAEVVTADIDTLEGSAPAGKALGTPGYMAPEQMSDPEVGRAADIYSLGSILFEILANEPLHPRGKPAIDSTITGAVVMSAALRRPDRNVPPELDALCVAMLAMNPVTRPTARRCAERVEEFLDGDRDVERRRTMATELVRAARRDLDGDHRTDAMRAASRALALDPNVAGAAEIVMRVMLEPPRVPPPELLEAIRRADAEDVSRHAKAAFPGYLLMAAFLPIIVWNGVLSWPLVIAAVGLALGMAAAAHGLRRQPLRSFDWMVIYAIGNAAVVATLGRVAGELTVVPALLAFITASVITYPMFLERPLVLLGIMLGGLFVPLLLEASGLIARSWELRDGGLFLRGVAMNYGSVSAVITVLLAATATIVMAAVQSTVLGRAARTAQHKLVAQAWHLRQLLPAQTRMLTQS